MLVLVATGAFPYFIDIDLAEREIPVVLPLLSFCGSPIVTLALERPTLCRRLSAVAFVSYLCNL